MSILNSKLAQDHRPLGEELHKLAEEGQKIGAIEGVQRLEMICQQYQQLSPNTAYLWVDMNAFQNEIEESQTYRRRVELLHGIRNLLSLLPLIGTWLALFTAVSAYQQDLTTNPDDRTLPFLVLWQNGFHGSSWQFSTVALIDAILLTGYLISIITSQVMERRSHKRAITFVQKLQPSIDKLMSCILQEGTAHVSDQADIDKVVHGVRKVVTSATEAMQKMVDGAMDTVHKMTTELVSANKEVMETTQHTIKTMVNDALSSLEHANNTSQELMKVTVTEAQHAINTSHTQVDDLLQHTVMPLMSAFHQDMGTLHTELNNYQSRLNELTSASKQLADASQKLATTSTVLSDNAERYVTIGQDIRTQIALLDQTQQEVVQRIDTIASNINTVASTMTTTTTNMIDATQAIENVSLQLQTGVQTTIDTMATKVDGVAHLLEQVGSQLQTVSHHLKDAAERLVSVQHHSFIGFFVKRIQHQKGSVV